MVVDKNAEPLLLTEIKTKQTIDSLDSPNLHHKAQAHAYMKGLSEEYDRKITETIILYGGRKTLNIRAFRIQFDPWFWREQVLTWAEQHTSYRLDDELPPADPEYNWECQFCPFRERCGQGETEFSNVGVGGLLPGFRDYPREKIKEYLESYPGTKLTPTLANEYPELATEYGAYQWRCEACGSDYRWNAIEWQKQTDETPKCPRCTDQGIPGVLRGPPPADQHTPKTDPEGEENDR